MTTTNIILNVFITNLGKYNEGELVGEWLELPATQKEIDDCLERIGIDYEEYEEYFITDSESDYGLKAGEYDDLDDLNDKAEQLANLDDDELGIITALMEEGGYDFDEALDELDNVQIYWNCNNMTDVAYEYLEESGALDGAPDFLARYFDYEAFGRDLQYDGNFMFINGNCYVIWA